VIIESVKIQGFRALYDAEVEPGSFTVLAGANNAGKTTLADALDFLAEVYRFKLEVALSRKGGFDNVAFRRMRRTRRPVSIEVRVAIGASELPMSRSRKKHDKDGQIVVTHKFAFKAASAAIAADFSVVEEWLTVDYRPDGAGPLDRLITATRNDAKVEIQSVGDDRMPGALASLKEYGYELEFASEQEFEGTVLFIEAVAFHPLIRQFTRALTGIRIFQISPLQSRLAGVPTPNPALERYGQNLPALIEYFRDRAPEAWESVFSAMQEIVPNLKDIDTDFSIDRRLVLRFWEQGVGRPWNANEISDGTIQSLALFSALFDPRITLAFIEEPENSVHPWIVRVFAEACRRAADAGKQIFVTTHSPALLQKARPSEVKLIWRSEGRSTIAPLLLLDPEAEKLWETGASDVFELLDSGALREAIPEGSA
jgi:predicted ATPase